jgi:hypothetical protein
MNSGRATVGVPTAVMKEFRALPPLASFFPLVFETGLQWDVLDGYCKGCDVQFSSEEFRGHVVRGINRGAASSYRELPAIDHVFHVEAWGFCQACRMLTPFRYNFHEGGSMEGWAPSTGQWVRWVPVRTSRTLWSRLRRLLAKK